MRKRLAETRFVRPGILWWAFAWGEAQEQCQKLSPTAADESKDADTNLCPYRLDEGDSNKGAVVLIDEIDKADSAVPNGLLEALGNRSFHAPWIGSVAMQRPRPLIVVTTNEERALPDAFLRRCFVLHMEFPRSDDVLLDRGRAHAQGNVEDRVLKVLVRNVKGARTKADTRLGQRPPGQAEFVDLVRALAELETTADEQLALLEQIQDLAFSKHAPPEADD